MENALKIALSEILCWRKLDSSGSGYNTVAGLCECDNEISGSISYGEYLEELSDRQLFHALSFGRLLSVLLEAS
jgi:hypothetical protein